MRRLYLPAPIQMLCILTLILSSSLAMQPRMASAAFLGDGTAASCTEAALDAALARGGTIRLRCGTGHVTIPITSEKVVSRSTTIDGRGRVRLDANGGSRIFAIDRPSTDASNDAIIVSLTGLTLINGATDTDGGAIFARPYAELALYNVTISGSSAIGYGGAIYSWGPLTIDASRFTGNQAETGGAVTAEIPITVTSSWFADNQARDGGALAGTFDAISDSVFTRNRATDTAGAIRVMAVPHAGTTLTRISATDNTANYGGALAIFSHGEHNGPFSLTESVIEDNHSNSNGGGIVLLSVNSPQATITDSSITGNSSGLYGGGVYVYGSDDNFTIERSTIANNSAKIGGGIGLEGAELETHDTRVSGNVASEAGGGIGGVEGGFAILNTTMLTGNRAGTDGGGLALNYVSVVESTIADNQAGGKGGGIFTNNGMNLNLNTIARNTADMGGGIYSDDVIHTQEPGTISGNHARVGGAIYLTRGWLLLGGYTIARNTADEVAGIYLGPDVSSFVIGSSILANGSSNCGGTIDVETASFDSRATLSSDSSCETWFTSDTDRHNTSPLLGPLRDNGGPTPTHALLPGSPAIDANPYTGPGADQRGVLRPQGGAYDIGAYELDPNQLPTVTAPVHEIVSDGRVASDGRVLTALTWAGTHSPSGIARYELEQQIDGGAFVTLLLTNGRSQQRIVADGPGLTYTFRVRAIDQAGTVGDWATGPTFSAALLQENDPAISYAISWRSMTTPGATGGTTASAETADRTATVAVNGTAFAWIATMSPERGTAEVWIDGRFATRVDLSRDTYAPRRVVFVADGLPPGDHTLEIRALGEHSSASSSTGTRIDLDAIIVLD